MAQEVFMKIPDVEKMSRVFDGCGETLMAVAKTLEAISLLLKSTAWLSLGSTAAMATFIDRILPNIKRSSVEMKSVSEDIMSAIRAYRDGDMSGSRRFI
jgi:hypothetical protein